MLDARTGRRCPSPCYHGEVGSDLCWRHYEGPEKTAARKKGGAAYKTLWQRIKAGSTMLKQAKTRAGMQDYALYRMSELVDERDPILVASLDRNAKLAAQLAAEIEDGGDNTQSIEVGVTINVQDRGELGERLPEAALPKEDEDGQDE
jgi:hypothetical protein